MRIPAFIAGLTLFGAAAAADPLDITGETENIIVRCAASVSFRMAVSYPPDQQNAPSIARQSGGAVVNPGGYSEKDNAFYWPKAADVILPAVARASRVSSQHPTDGTRVYELNCAYGFTVKNQTGYVTDTHRLTTVSRTVRTRGECKEGPEASFTCEPGFTPPEQNTVKKFQKGLDELIQKVDPD